MKNWRMAGRLSTATMSVLLLSACGSGSAPNTPNAPTCTVSGVTVVANPTTMNTGVATSLTATVNATSACTQGVTWSATPATGGTLTPSGLTATFTAVTAGAYTISATSSADPTKSGSVTISVTSTVPPCGQTSGATVTHSADIAANETWAGDGVTHVIPSSFSIRGSAIVTVQPCAIVALGAGVSITVRDNARLVSAGTGSTRFVTFRRNDPNQAWGALRGFHPTTVIDLTWTRLENGGAFGGLSDPSIAVIGNGYGLAPVAVLRTDNVVIQGSRGVGVYLDANAAFTGDSRQLQITGAGGRPLHTTMMALGSIPIGTYTGNGNDEILIHGPGANVFANMTVEDHGVPVRIPFTGLYVGPVAPSVVPVTLTLRPGVILRFPKVGNQTGARVTFGTNGAAPNNLVGILNAVGTAAKPIVFTSGEASPARGDWVGIWLNTANGSRLDHVEINYAGGQTGIQSNNCRPLNTEDEAGLFVGSFSDQYVPPGNLITNSRITNSAGFGINAMWLAGTFNTPDLTATNVFQNNARCRQTYNGVTPPGTCPMGGGCTAS
ncbi:MAG: hypothetical protein AB1762_08355 [Gemmatimonadota bacterium]